MEVIPTRIPDVKLIKPRVFGDERGFFMETWNARAFAEAGVDNDFVQDNHSRSIRYTLRGLHYQIERPQGKLVRAVKGKVFDVAVDMRKKSKTYGKWVGEVISEYNNYQLWVPPGFAHGFLVLSEYVDFVYKCTDFYSPESERCIRWDDTDLEIEWPICAKEKSKIIISEKDRNGERFCNADFYT